MKYKASTDLFSKIVTLLTILFFIFMFQMSIRDVIRPDGVIPHILIQLIAPAFFALFLFLAWFFAPRSYHVDDQYLTINRPAGNIKISLQDIVEIRPVSSKELWGLIRTFGNGGLFGYYGRFYASNFGSMTFYATKLKNRILIITRQGRKIIITPDEKALMIHVKQNLHKN